MTTQELETLINLRAETLADIKFNEFKKELNKVNPYTNKVSVFHSFTAGELKGRRKQVYDTICKNPGACRHELHTILNETYGKFSFTGMGARITELLQSGLIQVVGIKEGRFGKAVSTFGKVA